MKKILSAILILTLSLGLFGCAETNRSAADKLMKLLASGKYTMECVMTQGDRSADMTLTADLKSGRMHVKGNEGGEIVSVLLNESGFYIIDETEKRYIAFPMETDFIDRLNRATSSPDYKHTDSGSGKIGNINCVYEEYSAGASGTKYRIYVNDCKVVGIDMDGTVMEITSVSKTIDEDLFEIPDGYEIIEF